MTAVVIVVIVAVAICAALSAYWAIVAVHTRSADRRPEPAVTRSLHRLVASLLRWGIRLGPIRLLTIRGRTTGVPRTNPVDLFQHAGRSWLIATHRANAHWVSNLRAAGEGLIETGHRQYAFTATELPKDQAEAVLRDIVGPRLAKPLTGLALRRALGLPRGAATPDFAHAGRHHPVFELALQPTPEETMDLVRAKGPLALITAGAAVAVVQVTLAVAGVMTTAQWAGGLAIGLVIAGLRNHLRILSRHRANTGR